MKLTDKNNKPRSIRPDYTNIPEELRELPQFIMWKYVWREGESCWAKVPYTTGKRLASTTNPDTWSTFEDCTATVADDYYDGIGFVFTKDDPYIGVDIDECVTGSKVNEKANELVDKLQSYTEFSPSKSGVHIICKGSIPKAARGKWEGENVEIYSEGRYFTFTGQPVDGEVKPITERTMAVRRVVGEIEKERSAKAVETSIERQLRSALEKPHIRSLYEGDTSEYAGDQSAADLALCAKLAPYARGDRALLDAMFRRSALFRGKWDELRGADTYGNMTMDKVLISGSPTQPFNLPSGEPSTKESRRAGRFTVDSLWDRVMDFRKNGDARGYHPGWDQLEKYYRPTLGSMSVLLGEPGAGKSTWIDALTYNMCKEHNWRITMASFESLPIERHINNLCQIHLQKPTYTFLAGHASDKEMEEARVELNEWFNFISPADDDLTMETMLKYVEDDIEEWGVNGFVLDPWTEMDIRAGGGSEVDAIKNELKRLQQFTRTRNIHSWLLVHPTKSNKETYRQEARGVRPTLYSASGAAHFRNKADFGLVIHRWEDETVSLYIDKVRNSESSGTKGVVDFKFDTQRRLYVEEENDTW